MPPLAPEHLDALASAVGSKPPVVTGVLPLPKEYLTLFYGKAEEARRIELSHAVDPVQMARLAQTCDAATFGVNNKDVLDESYRKAGKLDRANFATNLGEIVHDLIEKIHPQLLEGHDNKKKIVTELYKLNIYGEDAFFKPHKDTPRGANMFGSLVLVFPTPHEGGALVFRHAGKEWTFDSSKALASSVVGSDGHIGYAAFFSDVEHEVLPVISGHRVTITYNLYFGRLDAQTTVAPLSAPSENEMTFQATLERLLADPTFLAEGGNLGFGFTHQYPMDTERGARLEPLLDFLKGRDAIVLRVCCALGLKPSLQVVYRIKCWYYGNKDEEDEDDEREVTFTIMLDHIPSMDYEIEDPVEFLTSQDSWGGRGIIIGGPKKAKGPKAEVHWVTRMTTLNKVGTDYIAYGNEASLEKIYGNICLIVSVGPAGERQAASVVPERR